MHDLHEEKLKLLSCVEVEQAACAVADLLLRACQAKAVAVLMWDADLESFADKILTGPCQTQLKGLVEAFCESDAAPGCLREINPGDYGVEEKSELSPVVCHNLYVDSVLCACVLICAPGIRQLPELEDELRQYPLAQVLAHAWEYRELRRENERLRTQYEHLEDAISAMEEQTRKVIHDLMAKDALHTRKIERERLVYSISNAVRSSLRLQEVLQTAVDQIGRELKVSRCLLLRQVESAGAFTVYEYHASTQSSAIGLFQTEQGKAFFQTALTREALQDLHDPSIDRQNIYAPDFIRKLGLQSGLIVPLILRDRKVGIIFLQDCQSQRQWSIDDTAVLGFLADLLSVHIENAELHQERERQSVTDGLTGIANRRHFNECFQHEFERAKRYGQPLSLIVADLDYLKKVNDKYGHQAGDEAIKAIARVLNEGSRSIDLAARFGGEEFCLLLPNTDLSMAYQTAERLRSSIWQCTVEGPGNISASIGVASFPEHADDADDLFKQADQALYAAKQNGRNCVSIASPKKSVLHLE